MKKYLLLSLAIAHALLVSQSAFAAKAGDSFSAWLRDPQFKKMYGQALAKSPVNHGASWVYKDAGLGKSTAIAGQNGNTWLRLSTCNLPSTPLQCQQNRIDIFYDVPNKELFAYLRAGNRVGWIGSPRNPISLEQKFFNTYLKINQD